MQYGHFDTRNNEYVLDRPDAPQSWTNYLGTKDYASVISHVGGGYSYYKSPEHGRVTRFRQNTVAPEGPGKYVYVRDDETGDYWSISWMPVGKPFRLPAEDGADSGSERDGSARYTAAHGMGYTRFECDYRGIEAKQVVFIPLDDDVEIWDVTLTNKGNTTRTLTTATYVEFSFHHIEIDNQNLQMSLYASGSSYEGGIIQYDFYYEPWTYHYFASSEMPSSFDTLRDQFIGAYRTERNPIAVEVGHGSDSSGTTQNHCGSLQHKITLEPGETRRIIYMTGYGKADTVGKQIQSKYSNLNTVDSEYERLRDYWRAKMDKLQIDTPNPALDTLINAWTLLQAETTVVWSRFASFVEVGGRHGLGYRDTAQDAMSVIHSNPTKSRQRIVELLRAQTPQGYGLHLFDPQDFDPDREELPGIPSPTIVPRTEADDLIHGLDDACSDDHLWLVPTIAEYVKETGDTAFLDEVIPFADGTPATVYDHLRAALDFSSKHVGDNGVALGLRADWNDCLNLGGGESALVTFLHAWAIRAFQEVAEAIGRPDDAAAYDAEFDRIKKVSNEQLWDGAWWVRGFTSEGVKIGSQESAEGKIFLEHQAWPVIAGLSDQERGEKAMDSVTELLGSPYGNHLNWPAFTEVDDTVGFVTRVYPGVKENAAIFSHPNAWPIIAETVLGRGNEAMAMYDAIAPYNQNDIAETRGAEPYAYAQFIYGRDHDLYGKAQNPWLTGTAGWMYTAATKHILGIRPSYETLFIDPCIPNEWDGFTVKRHWRGADYLITVKNPDHVSKGVKRLEVDGVEVDPAQGVPQAEEGSKVEVKVVLG